MIIKNLLFCTLFVWIINLASSCDETACNVGTSLGTAACATGAAIGGAALCAVTFGIGCAVATGLGAACPAIGETITNYGCPACSSPEAQNEDLPLSQVLLGNNEQSELISRLDDKLTHSQNEKLGGHEYIFESLDSLDENQKTLIRKHIEARRLHYVQLVDKTQNHKKLSDTTNRLQRLQTHDVSIPNDLRISKSQALLHLENRQWFKRLDDTGRNLLRGQEEIMSFQFMAFVEQDRMLSILDENDKKLLKGQDSILENQLHQFIKQEQWFQRLDTHHRDLLEGQGTIIGLQYKQLLQLDDVKEIQQQIYRKQLTLEFRQLAHKKEFDAKFQKLFVGQSMLLAGQLHTKKALDKLSVNIAELGTEAQRTQLIVQYGNKFQQIQNSKGHFDTLYNGNVNPSQYQIDEFKESANSPNFKHAIANIQWMLMGGKDVLVPESLYEKLPDYCHPEMHAQILRMCSEALMMRTVAYQIDNITIARNEIDQFIKNNINATNSYITHCGCPDGFEKKRRNEVSELLPNLHPSNEDKITNAIKMFLLADQDDIWRLKAFTLLKHKNFDILEGKAIQMISETSVEDVDLAIEMDSKNQADRLPYFDNTKSCINKQKNGISKLIDSSTDFVHCIWIIFHCSATAASY